MHDWNVIYVDAIEQLYLMIYRDGLLTHRRELCLELWWVHFLVCRSRRVLDRLGFTGFLMNHFLRTDLVGIIVGWSIVKLICKS